MMSQNTSHAVMAQRAEPHDSLDDFPTPSWATRALIEHVIGPEIGSYSNRMKTCSVWEPACNRGFMARPLAEYFGETIATDINHYGWGGQQAIHDFLSPQLPPMVSEYAIKWVISNPPFRLAQQFIERSFNLKGWRGTAMLVRTAFLESVGRYQNLFKPRPPSIVAQFSERVPMFKGRVDPTGSTATAYCWLVWIDREDGAKFVWIPPCRRELERPRDYEVPA